MIRDPSYNPRQHALDELHGELLPTQFAYLCNVVTSSDGIAPSDTSTYSSQPLPSHFEFPETSSSRSSSSESELAIETLCRAALVQGSQDQLATREVSIRKVDNLRKGGTRYPKLQSIPRQLPIHQVSSSSLDSTSSPFSGYNTRRESMLALKGASFSIDDPRIASNLRMAQLQYEGMEMPLVVFQGAQVSPPKKTSLKQSCNEAPACKKTLEKYTFHKCLRSSRSSSTETVRADSLPDLDSPSPVLEKIAGRIANEPVNTFPILRKPPGPKPPSRKKPIKAQNKLGSHNWDMARAEREIDKMLEPSQDYKDVSEFFSKRAGTRVKAQQKATKSITGVYNLSRRVTNPLYKVYDPAGYKKTEDEMALECIEMICSDFNKWIQSLADNRDHDDADKKEREKTPEIGPDFLVRILREELELP